MYTHNASKHDTTLDSDEEDIGPKNRGDEDDPKENESPEYLPEEDVAEDSSSDNANDTTLQTPQNKGKKLMQRRLVPPSGTNDSSTMSSVGQPLASSTFTNSQNRSDSQNCSQNRPKGKKEKEKVVLTESQKREKAFADKIIIEFLARKQLPVDWIFDEEKSEVIDLKDKNSKLKKSKPLLVEFFPNYPLERHKKDSKKADVDGFLIKRQSKENFREILAAHPDCFGLAKIGQNHYDCLFKHHNETDHKQNCDFGYWMLQFIQIKPIVNADLSLDEKENGYNPTTGNSYHFIFYFDSKILIIY